jgi:dGTPase
MMMDHGGFNHNHHSYRIVTQLEKRYPEFNGLNLTWEVLEGIVKHETDYDVADAANFDPELRGHLEAQIANVADELAYTAHDLDDGLRSGMITPDQLAGVSLWEVINESIGRRRSDTLDDLARHRLIRRLINVEELQKLPYNVVGFSEDMHRRNRELKDFLFKNLYNHYRVVRMAVKADRIIENLFTAYVEEPTILPDPYQALIDENGLEETVCDYIAGMTDRFAIDEHEKIFDPTTLP